MAADRENGLLVLDKPAGLTSRDAVNRAQRWFPARTPLGHTGTLDPLATGVLVLCVGRATRLAEYVQAMPKTYTSTFLLGHRSDTDDADGTVIPVEGAWPRQREEVERALQGFVGMRSQVPPAFSAAKVTGRRAYDLARRGQAVELAPREVAVYGIDVLAYDWPRLEVEVRCGKGTYIRSLARDLGQILGCGGLVEVLRRTRVGPFTVEGALTLDADAAAVRSALRPMAEAVSNLPRLEVTDDEAARLLRGNAIRRTARLTVGEAAAFDGRGLLAVVRCDAAEGWVRPDKVFPRGDR